MRIYFSSTPPHLTHPPPQPTTTLPHPHPPPRSPTSYILWGLAGSQLCDRDIPMTTLGGQNTTVGAFMESYWGYTQGMIWWTALIIAAYILFFRVGSVLLLKYVSYERR